MKITEKALMLIILVFVSCSKDADWTIQSVNEDSGINLSLAKQRSKELLHSMDGYNLDNSVFEWNDLSLFYVQENETLSYVPLNKKIDGRGAYLIIARLNTGQGHFIFVLPEPFTSLEEYIMMTPDKLFRVNVSGYNIGYIGDSRNRTRGGYTLGEVVITGHYPRPALPRDTTNDMMNFIRDQNDYGGAQMLQNVSWIDLPVGGGGGGRTPSVEQNNDNYKETKKVLADSAVKKQLEEMKKQLIADTSKAKGRRERGFFIYYNNKTKEYVVGDINAAPNYTKGGEGTNASISTWTANKLDKNGEHVKGLEPIAFVHCHTPLSYEENCTREVGPSKADSVYARKHTNMLFIIYDYEGTKDNDGNSIIEGGHNKNDKMITYTLNDK